MNDPRGALWRKWDLHVHTPASIIQNYGGDTAENWEKFFRDVEALPSEFKVIGINDYIFIDGYKKVLEAKEKGRLANIDLILPVIELRLDKFGGYDGHLSRVNFHIIFSNDVEPDIIQQQFLHALPRHYCLTPAYEYLHKDWKAIPTKQSLADLGKLIKSHTPGGKKSNVPDLILGFNNINFRLEAILDILESSYFKDKHYTAVGKTEWANIKWTDQSIADKKNIINRAHFVFISAKTVNHCLSARESLTNARVNDRLLDCSDAHHFSGSSEKERIGKCYTWIKADTTFEGLKQVFNEPEGRIFIGDVPDKINAVAANKTKYVRSISIKKKPGSKLNEIWFDSELEFNTGLVAIVGNKGMGKSALADIIGFLGNTKNQHHFSFLSTKRFRQQSNNKSTQFEAELSWESGSSVKKGLEGNIDPSEVEVVKYIPQNFFESICNEIPSREESVFDKEIKKVIFSHVKEIDRLGRTSMEDLISYKTKETYDAIEILKEELQRINREITDLETRSTEEYRFSIERQLQVKKDELVAHEQSKPEEVPKPDVVSQQESTQIATLKTQKKELEYEIADIDRLRKTLAISITSCNTLIDMLDNFFQRYENFRQECLAELDLIGLTFDSVVTLVFNKTALLVKRTELYEEKNKLEWVLNKTNAEGPVYGLEHIEGQLDSIKKKMDELSNRYYSYLSSVEAWAKKRGEIIGDGNIPESLRCFEKLLNDLKKIPVELAAAKLQRNDLTKSIYSKIKKLTATYKELYQPVEDFIRGHHLAKQALALNFDVSIINVAFQERFFDWISHSVSGSFCGANPGQARLKDILAQYDFNDESGILNFINEIMECLMWDKRQPTSPPVKVTDQLKKGQTLSSLYDFIFSLDYLKPRYVLKMGGKELHQLSPGEKGAVLLIFYLLVDNDDIPLIIDQPEENLDNQTISALLVPFIKEVKRRRQIFIVTHNPNLAVVSDAEQVIWASQDKVGGNRIEYISGAIENPAINRQLMDILEGTRPAFDNRTSKYLPDEQIKVFGIGE